MPLAKVSVKQLEAAQQLYEAATKFMNEYSSAAHNREIFTHNDPSYARLVAAVTRCKEEYDKYGDN